MGQHKFIFKLLIVVVVIAAGFWAYRFFFVGPPVPPEGLNALNYAGEGDTEGTDEFIALINQLQSVNLKTDLFANPAFQALKNFSKPLVPEPKGRSNPFLPISAVIGSATTASSTNASTTRNR